MDIERISFVLPVDDLAAAVAGWAALLGVEPTFVDADRWAQFDVAGARIALAGRDRASEGVALMAKVADLAAAREEAMRLGHETSEPEAGLHELRCTVAGPGRTPVVLYSSVRQ